MNQILTEPCENLISSYIKNYSPFDFSNPLNNGGQGFNDLGKYDKCIMNNSDTFLVLKLLVNITDPIPSELPVFLGLCLPNECNNNYTLTQFKLNISQYLNIDENRLEIVDSRKENSKYQIWDGASISIISILVIYVLFASGLIKLLYDSIIIKKKLKNEGTEDGYRTSSDEIKSFRSLTFSSKGRLSNSNEDNLLLINSGSSVEEKEKDLSKINNTSNSNTHFFSGDNYKKTKFYIILENLFDFSKNYHKIFETRENEDKDLKIFDGIRVITCVIIVIDHVCSLYTELPLRNPTTTYDYFRSFSWQFFFNSIFTVDLFFSLSGFFLAYMTLKQFEGFKKASVFQLCLNVFLRVLRIWPVYSLIFLFYWKFYSYFLDGPISGYLFNKELDSCEVQWPFMLTFLTNFTYGLWEKAYPFCMSWYWYIPNDFQYCVIGLILLAIYTRSKSIFYIFFGIMNIAFWSIEGYLAYQFDLGINALDLNSNPNYYKYYYLKFYTRSSPFWIGLWLGIIYSQYKRELSHNQYSKIRLFFESIKDSTIISLIFYSLGLLIMMSLTFCTYWSYDTNWPFWLRITYHILSKKFYIIGLFMLSFPLMLGNLYIMGGWLGSQIFLPFAKLSFSVYIIHPLLIKFVIFNIRTALYFNGFYIILTGLSFALASYCLSILICALFEMPFQNIRDLFKKKARSQIKNSKHYSNDDAPLNTNIN
jgi:peptidoglycan/LPS O-acetylase OafA/YrhL